MTALAVHEEPLFAPIGGERLFAFLHRAVGPVRGGLLVCHAFAEEKLWSHRVYVSFAREAARAGFTVLRFDMRGEGDSSLDFAEATIESRVEDTLHAAALLRSLDVGVARVFAVGHRLGGSIAAAAVAENAEPFSGVVAWDPILDGTEYFGQLLRSNLATQLATGGRVTRAREALVEAILNGEVVSVDGYGLTAALYRGMQTLSWDRLAVRLPRPALLLEVAKGEQTAPSAPLAALASDHEGLSVELVQEPPFWRETRQFHRAAASLSSATLAWLGERCP